MSAANEMQVGGNHYKTSYEHWDFVLDTGLGYFEGQVTRYVSRWRKKGGFKDLQKSLHFVNKMLENVEILQSALTRKFTSCVWNEIFFKVLKFAEANGLSSLEEDCCLIMTMWHHRSDLHDVRDIIMELMDQADPPDMRPVPLEDSNKHAPRAEPC